MFLFNYKYYPENFALLILKILEFMPVQIGNVCLQTWRNNRIR